MLESGMNSLEVNICFLTKLIFNTIILCNRVKNSEKKSRQWIYLQRARLAEKGNIRYC